jgi:hypothetical protein
VTLSPNNAHPAKFKRTWEVCMPNGISVYVFAVAALVVLSATIAYFYFHLQLVFILI